MNKPTDAEEIRKLLDRLDDICKGDWTRILEEIDARQHSKQGTSAKKTPREDVNQAAARVVREATERD